MPQVTLSRTQIVYGVAYKGTCEVTPPILAQLQMRNQRRPGLIVEPASASSESTPEAQPESIEDEPQIDTVESAE